MSGSHKPAGAADGPAGHYHDPAAYDRAFAAGIVLSIGYFAVEAFFGFASNSLPLLADAGHNLGDVGGLLLAWAAAWLTRRASTQRHTYGFGRASIMASLINAIVLLVTVGGIAWEAIWRLPNPQPVDGKTVMWVAAAGILVNAGTAALFWGGSKSDLNIRGAFLHMAADAGVTPGVVIAALAISLTGWLWLDPAVSLGIGLVIAIGSWGLFRESLNLAMDAIPACIDRSAVAEFLSAVPGVVAVHDLHICPLSTSSVAMTAHLVKPDAVVDDDLLCRLSDALHERFDIDHTTLQIERGGGDCPLADLHAPAPDRRS